MHRFSMNGVITPVVKEQEYLLGDRVLYNEKFYIVKDVVLDYFGGDSRLPYKKVILKEEN